MIRRHLSQTDSTSSWLRQNGHKLGNTDEPVVVTADYQTAGRGQGSNHWESQPAQNLLFSLRVCPSFLSPERQFILSKTFAVALCKVLGSYADGMTVKWPNDIYWHDRKISGTLIELQLQGGRIGSAIIGAGVNINQRQFFSDAPNPVSLWQIIRQETDREEVLDSILSTFMRHYGELSHATTGALSEQKVGSIDALYHQKLYRKEGYHSYRDANGEFTARIDHVADNGTLHLMDSQGCSRCYSFKEVAFVIQQP